MIITVNVHELDEEVRNCYRDGSLKSISLDYADHALLGYIDKKEVVVYDFKKALKFDNRYSGNELSFNEHCITIRIT